MSVEGFTLFESALGRCGIAWTAHGVALLQLPEGRDDALRARVLRRVGRAVEHDEPPAPIADAIARITALLRGEPDDLRSIQLDLRQVPEFQQRVYDAARRIPVGKTVTYGELARLLAAPGSARAIGQAMGHNPYAIIVPCHRVVAAGGRIGGFSARGGADTKLRMLAIERRAVQQDFQLELGDVTTDRADAHDVDPARD